MDNEYLKRIYGLLESGATLGTGAVSGLVGLPYGLYKGVTSGAYGTPEAPRIAAREAQQFMERNTYQPRTAEGQANLQQLAGLLEASKLPPVMPEASLLAAIPKQAYAAQAERAGMAAEKAIAPVVTRTMERGGLPAQLLGDLAQGSRRQIFVPASQEEAFQAAKLLRKKTPEEVWKETGVAKFGDDFVKEISDKESSFNTVADIHESAEKIRQRNAELKQILNESKSTYPDLFPKELTAARKPLREEIKANQGLLEMPRGYVSDSSFSGNMAAIAYEHPELYKQVPEMKGVVIRQGRDLGDFLGAYENSPSRPLGSIDITKLGLKNDPRSTATHEMQHAVQEFYGLPGGGTPEEFMREAIADRNLLNSKIDDLNKKMREVSGTPEYDKIMEQRMALTQEYLDKGYGDMASVYKNASDQYQRLAGEAQSRLAQTRIDLTPEERRKYFPFAYGKENYGLDVKPEELIFRQGGLLGQSKAASDLPVGQSGLLGSPRSLTMPEVPTAQQMKKYARVETVPLSEAVSFQSARNWETFGKNPRGDLIKGYGDKPVALRLETGEYVIYDGNHRTDLALKEGKSELPMHVIDVKAYDPAHAGRKPAPEKMTDDELLRSLLD